MKLLLIYPPAKNIVFEASPSIVSEEAGNYPPMGLLSLATSVISRGRHEVKVLDSIAEKMDIPGIEEYIRKEKPGAVGITLVTDYLKDGLSVAIAAKRVSPDIKVIAGGHHVCLFPFETIEQEWIDAGVVGDGEYVINDILDNLSEGKSLDGLEGVVTKANYRTKTPKRLIVENLDNLPVVRRDLIDYRKYKSVLAKGVPVTTMLTSRGCPFNCPYCSGGNIKARSNSVGRVIEEIESCVKLGIRDILFFDELFTLNKRRVTEICDELIRRSIKIRWHARARVDGVDRDMIRKMKKAGCRLLQFGIETGSDRQQKILQRKLTTEKISEVIKVAREEGVLTYGNFMVNLPGETPEEMEQTIEFAIKLKLDYAVFGILSVFPKTEFYEQVLKEKKISEDFWALYARDPLNYRIKTVEWPGMYSAEELDNFVKQAYRRFYFRPGYLIKALFRDETLYQKYTQVRSGLKVLTRFFK